MKTLQVFKYACPVCDYIKEVQAGYSDEDVHVFPLELYCKSCHKPMSVQWTGETEGDLAVKVP